MRILFFGSGEFAVPALHTLVEAGHDLPLVITQPDRRAGRGGHLTVTPVKAAAQGLGIPVYQPDPLNSPEALACIRNAGAQLAVIAAYGRKISPVMLAAIPGGFINAHASLLPRYRGAAPVPHAILHGDRETGVTVFQLNEEWDSGPVFGYARTELRADDTASSVLSRLSQMAGELLLSVIADLSAEKAVPLAQDPAEVTPAPKFTREDGRIDWRAEASLIDRRVRAFQPWPLAFCSLPGRKGANSLVTVLKVERRADLDGKDKRQVAGTVLVATPRDGLIVSCGSGEALSLLEIKPEGKRAMLACEYLRGSPVEPGTLLS